MRQDIATYIQLDGQITPLQQSNLSLPQSGTLSAVYVTEGTRVSKGELLAKIDDSTLRAQLAQAKATLTGSSLSSPVMAQQNNSALATARTNVVSAQAAYDNAKIVYNGDKQLYAQGYVAQTALEQARSQYVAAEQTLASNKAALKAAQQNLTNTAVQQTQVAANAAQVKQLQTAIEQTSLYAPYDGVITARLLDPGAFAGPNANILQISQVDTVYVNANVPDDQLGYVRPGTQVSFTTSSLPGANYHGRVFDVNAVPTAGTLSYRARIVESNPGDRLRGGMLVTVSVRTANHPNALVVPRTAIFQNENGSSVFVIADGKPGADGKPTKVAKQVPVTVGLQTDVLTEVRNPSFGAGTLVVTTRPDALADGSTVAVTQTGAPAGAGASSPASGKKPG
ncbi:MAG: efflux RND transporter periplasmic adaptor subunit [Candidatus Eremiobacteraeota bacterium]|nr:efflux RND transporter periplasmic adaptor subunit [Candidatus Eremiobacteraeota bacterium]